MVRPTYVQNKLIKVTIIVDISIRVGLMRTVCVQRVSKALFIRTLRWKHAVHSLPECDVVMDELCVVYVWVSENTTNLERVLHLCLTLDWRWFDVLLAPTFTRGKTLTFLSMQKMCAEVDAHQKWITFIRRSRQIINEFWRMPSEHNLGYTFSKCYALSQIPQ